MQRPLQQLSSTLILLWLFSAAPALAEDPYAEGMRRYSQGQYAQAKDLFLKVAGDKPLMYQSHYLLANTYYKLNQLTDARTWYDICLKCNPDDATAQNCKKAIALLDKEIAAGHTTADPPAPAATPAVSVYNRTPTPAKAAPATAKPAASTNKIAAPESTKDAANKDAAKAEIAPTAKEHELTDAEKTAAKKRHDIISDAEKQAASIKQGAQRELKELEESGNYYVFDHEPNSVHQGVPGNVRDRITTEANERAFKILEEAHKQADRIPGAKP